jgi:hypothetical protein
MFTPGIGPATVGVRGFELFSAPTQPPTVANSIDAANRILIFFMALNFSAISDGTHVPKGLSGLSDDPARVFTVVVERR